MLFRPFNSNANNIKPQCVPGELLWLPLSSYGRIIPKSCNLSKASHKNLILYTYILILRKLLFLKASVIFFNS